MRSGGAPLYYPAENKSGESFAEAKQNRRRRRRTAQHQQQNSSNYINLNEELDLDENDQDKLNNNQIDGNAANEIKKLVGRTSAEILQATRPPSLRHSNYHLLVN